jgi:hypothetical protein
MSAKKIIWIFMFVGGIIGGYVPTLWGASTFSMSTLFFNAAGAIAGVWLGFKITR